MIFSKQSFFVSAFIISTSTICSAQNFDSTNVQNSQIEKRNTQIRPEVNYHESDELKVLSEQYIESNSTVKTINGFRIEIFSSSGANSKLKARNYRLQFVQKYDSIPAYVVWEYPNFEVRTGDFRTKLEAEKALQNIIVDFPFAFITKDEINIPECNKAVTE